MQFITCFLVGIIPLMLGWGIDQETWTLPNSQKFPKTLTSQNSPQKVPAQVIQSVRQDLSRRTKIPPHQFKLVQASQQTWTDGCLGLGKPKEICSQALVNGWRVVMSDGRRTWIYRTDGQGRTVRLQGQK
jgi:hypothetical protein